MAGLIIPKATGIEFKYEPNQVKIEGCFPLLQFNWHSGLKAEKEVDRLWQLIFSMGIDILL